MGHRINECYNTKAAKENATFIIDEEREQENEKVKLTFDAPSWVDNDLVCKIDGNPFFVFTRNTFIGNTGASCYIINNDYGILMLKLLINLCMKVQEQWKQQSWEKESKN